MSILIKGMEMPRNCMACDFEQVDEYELSTECPLIYKGHTYKCRTEGRLPDCPLVEISDEQPDDTISRQDAIDLIEDIETKRLRGEIGLMYAPAIKGLKALPPAQPEQRWIPVTDHIPDEDVPVLVTDDAGGMATVGIDSCGRYEDTGERFWYTSQNVTAWMYTVEPYGGEKNGDSD